MFRVAKKRCLFCCYRLREFLIFLMFIIFVNTFVETGEITVISLC